VQPLSLELAMAVLCTGALKFGAAFGLEQPARGDLDPRLVRHAFPLVWSAARLGGMRLCLVERLEITIDSTAHGGGNPAAA
jgi:hypothetical protein